DEIYLIISARKPRACQIVMVRRRCKILNFQTKVMFLVRGTEEGNVWGTSYTYVNVTNAPPVVNANGPYYGVEGSAIVLEGTISDEDVGSCTSYWEICSERYYQNPLIYVFDDDFHGNVRFTAIDSSGLEGSATAMVNINNSAPKILELNATYNINISYRIAGEKWHDSTLHLYADGIELLNITVYREPGQPNTEIVRSLTIDATKNYTFYANWSPENDPVNGNKFGASPVWLNLTFEDGVESFHHTFVWSPGHKDTEWRGYLNPYIHRHPLTLQAHAKDAGNDLLAFNWDFGDGNTSVHFYQHEGRDIVKHAYAVPGNYSVVLVVNDDDGGSDMRSLNLHMEGYGNVTPNLPPVVDFDIWNGKNESVNAINESEDVYFISKSYDPEMKPLTVFWLFGDGSSATDVVVHRSFNSGIYNITLYASDGWHTTYLTKTLVVRNVVADVRIEGSEICSEGTNYTYTAVVNAVPTDLPYIHFQWFVNGDCVGHSQYLNYTFTSAGNYTILLITSDDEGSVSTVIYVNVSNVVPELYCMQHMEVIANTIYLDAAVFDSVNDYGMLNVSWMLVSFNGSVCNESLGYSRWLSYSGCEKGTGTYIFRCTVRDEIVSVSSELKVVLYCDSDGDLMQDIWEWTHGLNWRKNDSLEDPDNDGLKNIEEYYYGTHPQLRDTDGDGLTDGEEVQHYMLSPFNPDVDGDGLQDGTEVYNLYYYGTYWLNFVMFENTSREMNVSS
ncbi:MAG: PKD domain-containing protein, partial [Thermoplasmata archaeon]